MFLNSIDKKPLLTKDDGTVIRDLTQSMFTFKTNNYISYQAYRVPTEYAMRPDLIAQAVYNNTINAEYILKYNGIGNAFTISPGDVILVPDLNSAKDNIRKEGEGADSPENKIRLSYKYLDPTKAPSKDKKAIAFEDRNLKEGALPPNIAEEGAKQIVHRNGRVYFGEGVSESACLKNGMTSSEFLTTIIKSKKV
jgi:hypothetical protein